MSMISAVREFLTYCPKLATFSDDLYINYLDDECEQYSVLDVPVNPLIRVFQDGTKDKVFAFAITSREFYIKDNQIMSDNSEQYEEISEWFEQQTDAGILPNFGTGKTAYDIHTTSSGYIINNDLGQAVYQIQCEVLYEQSPFTYGEEGDN